jgi:hypothetical protein
MRGQNGNQKRNRQNKEGENASPGRSLQIERPLPLRSANPSIESIHFADDSSGFRCEKSMMLTILWPIERDGFIGERQHNRNGIHMQ